MFGNYFSAANEIRIVNTARDSLANVFALPRRVRLRHATTRQRRCLDDEVVHRQLYTVRF